jgi:hypothetical protein
MVIELMPLGLSVAFLNRPSDLICSLWGLVLALALASVFATNLRWLVCLRWLDEVSSRLGLRGLVFGVVLACVFVVGLCSSASARLYVCCCMLFGPLS